MGMINPCVAGLAITLPAGSCLPIMQWMLFSKRFGPMAVILQVETAVDSIFILRPTSMRPTSLPVPVAASMASPVNLPRSPLLL
jgi:hypothetical protein